MRADGPDAGKDARLSQEPRLPGRRHHHGREGPALVRRDRRDPHHARAADRARARDRHQRRRRRLPRRLYLFLSRQSRQEPGAIISSLRARHRPSRSSASATRPDCRRWPTSTRSSRNSRSGARRSFGISDHGPRRRRRQHQHGCGGDRRAASARRRDGRWQGRAVFSRRQGREPGGRSGQARRDDDADRPAWASDAFGAELRAFLAGQGVDLSLRARDREARIRAPRSSRWPMPTTPSWSFPAPMGW